MLPFVQPPAQTTVRRIGTVASGVLEVPVLGGLTVDESATVAELLAMEQSSLVKGAQSADAIAKAEGISLSEAFSIINATIQGQPQESGATEIAARHAELIQDVARVVQAAGQRNMEASVTAILRCRMGQATWSIADTRKLHRALFSGIWQLVMDEQAAEELQSEPMTEEDLKKQPAATGKPRKRTGKASSGISREDSPDSSIATATGES
jgi:predicted HNH restriction endonuclease